MSIFDRFFNRNKSDQDYFQYRLVLDIGTEYLKASMIEFNKSERSIIAFGRVRQDYGNMDGGAITNIDGVSRKAREAVDMLRDFTPHHADEMVCGIAGEFVKGVLLSLDFPREKPGKKIDSREIEKIIDEGKEKAYKKAAKMAEMETGIDNVKLELIQYNIVEIRVDGYKVKNPYQFQGQNLNIIVFYTYAPLVQMGALRTIARDMGCELVATMPEPLAVAEGILTTNESYEFGAVIIDIGGGTTDIAMIRNGGIEGTRMFAMGGRAFTRTLASNLNITLEKAEKIKLAYSSGETVENFKKVDKLIKSDLHILYQGIELSLQELADGELLPGHIYFCGGGSGLKGLISGFQNINLVEKLPIGRQPVIDVLRGIDIDDINDEHGLLTEVEYTTPRALAYFGSRFFNEERRLINLESQRV
ncbi:MAG: cell division FtsA domain-containing protein [Halanaerobiaceae bacterium]